MKVLLAFTLLTAASAQQFEIGALAGGGFLSSAPESHAASVSAGLAPGPTAGFIFAQNRYARWSGEIRYLFEERDPRITGAGTSTSFSGQTHAVHYDLIFKPRARSTRVQSYFSAGGGLKVFRGTGPEAAYRPLMQYAYLTRATEWKPMVALGAGIKFPLTPRWILRADFQAHVTPFPSRVITPAPGLSMARWLVDLVPTVGLSWVF